MDKIRNPGRWPKSVPQLTDEQKRIRDDFMRHWLEVLPRRYGAIEKFNHSYPLRTYSASCRKTLEIGAGRGEHLRYENLQSQQYVALELRPELGDTVRSSFPAAHVVIGDCQEEIYFPDHYFDRVLAIHVLEHLPNLPKALNEIQRVLSPGGQFSVVIPCEGGMTYRLARNVSARRIFERRYKQSYDWLVASEHVNTPEDILPELCSRFRIVHRQFFPLMIPSTNWNLVIGLTLKPITQ